MPFVNQRWLGGMLTNFQTVHQRILRLKELEEIDFDDVAGSSRTKKELLQMRREKDKLDRTLGGIRDMGRVPAAVWIVDTNKEHLAVDEARKLGIPIVAILDSNCDPDMVDYPIPGNDDAIRSVTLLTRIVADAVADGLMARAGVRTGQEATGEELGAEEPLAEWEKELLGRQADEAAAQAAAAPTGTAEVATVAADAVGEAPAAATASSSDTTDSAEGSDAPGAAAADGDAQSGSDEPVTVGGEPAGGGDTDPGTPQAAPEETVTTVGGEPADDATPA
jgi:small subunit ribosomal protein S2